MAYNYDNNDYHDYYDDETNTGNTDRIAGYALVLLMVIIVGAMGFMMIGSIQNPAPPVSDSPSPTGTTFAWKDNPDGVPTAGTEDSPSPTPSRTKKSTPKPSPTKKPADTPTSKPSPTPKKSPRPKPSPKDDDENGGSRIKKFHAAPVDTPPALERDHGEMFRNKRGKAYIVLTSKNWEGAKAYLIDKDLKKYRPIEFNETDKKNEYSATIPPGNYAIKITKAGYFSYKFNKLNLKQGQEAIIEEPLEKRPWLKLTSKPPDAYILINRKRAGKTPKTIRRLDDKEYEIILLKRGYKRKIFKLKFKRGKGITKLVRLEKKEKKK